MYAHKTTFIKKTLLKYNNNIVNCAFLIRANKIYFIKYNSRVVTANHIVNIVTDEYNNNVM